MVVGSDVLKVGKELRCEHSICMDPAQDRRTGLLVRSQDEEIKLTLVFRLLQRSQLIGVRRLVVSFEGRSWGAAATSAIFEYSTGKL